MLLWVIKPSSLRWWKTTNKISCYNLSSVKVKITTYSTQAAYQGSKIWEGFDPVSRCALKVLFDCLSVQFSPKYKWLFYSFRNSEIFFKKCVIICSNIYLWILKFISFSCWLHVSKQPQSWPSKLKTANIFRRVQTQTTILKARGKKCRLCLKKRYIIIDALSEKLYSQRTDCNLMKKINTDYNRITSPEMDLILYENKLRWEILCSLKGHTLIL